MSRTPVTHQDLIAEVVRLRDDVETLTTWLRLSSVTATTLLEHQDKRNRAAGPAVTTDLPARVGFGREGEIGEIRTTAYVDIDGSVMIDLGEDVAVVPVAEARKGEWCTTCRPACWIDPVALRPVV